MSESARFWFIVAGINMIGWWATMLLVWSINNAPVQLGTRQDCPVVRYPITVTVIEQIGI